MDLGASYDLVRQWHQSELSINYPQMANTRLLMGCPLWGEPYVPRFLNYVLPSILASREALQAYGWEMVIYTDGPGWAALSPYLYAWNIPAHLRVIPRLVMDVLNLGGVTKYWVLSAVHNALVTDAARRGCNYHMLVGDICYSDNYFDNLIKLGQQHEGIAQQALTISFGEAGPLLEGFRQPRTGILAVPARNLGQIASDHCVGEWKSWSMDGIENPAEEMPNSHFIFWRGPDSVRIHSAHMSAIWMSAAKCAQAGIVLGGTIDSELPRYLGQDFYVPTVADDMTYVAIDDSRSEPTPRTSFENFATSLLDMIGHRRDFLDYFRAPSWVPALPVDGHPSDEEIERRFQAMMAMIEKRV